MAVAPVVALAAVAAFVVEEDHPRVVRILLRKDSVGTESVALSVDAAVEAEVSAEAELEADFEASVGTEADSSVEVLTEAAASEASEEAEVAAELPAENELAVEASVGLCDDLSVVSPVPEVPEVSPVPEVPVDSAGPADVINAIVVVDASVVSGGVRRQSGRQSWNKTRKHETYSIKELNHITLPHKT